MKPKAYFFIILAALAFVPAGCDVKDPIYNTPHPEHGSVTLTTDWSGMGEGLTAPAGYTVAVGDYSATLSGATNLLDRLFNPGTYPILVCNTPEHITVSGGTATVATVSGNADGVGKFVHNAPGWLFTSAMDAVIAKDADHSIVAVMQQQVRGLTLMIEPTGNTAGRIERIVGRLSGVAGTLDFAGGMHATPMNVVLQFSEITSGTNAGRWSATVRLLGTAGTQQKMNATIYFTGDSPAALTIDSDLTAGLSAFNADKRTPLTLGGSVVETPTGADVEATITDWTTVKGGEITAD